MEAYLRINLEKRAEKRIHAIKGSETGMETVATGRHHNIKITQK